MNLVKLLIGAAVGAVLGIALLVGVEAFAQIELSWIVVVIGAVAGVAMRWLGGTGRASYLRGAAAALVTLATFIGGKYVVASVVKSLQVSRADQPAAAAPVDRPENDEAITGQVAEPVLLIGREPPPVDVMGMSLQRNNLSPLDAVWLVVGALVAYELGKGRNVSPTAGETRSSD